MEEMYTTSWLFTAIILISELVNNFITKLPMKIYAVKFVQIILLYRFQRYACQLNLH